MIISCRTRSIIDVIAGKANKDIFPAQVVQEISFYLTLTRKTYYFTVE